MKLKLFFFGLLIIILGGVFVVVSNTLEEVLIEGNILAFAGEALGIEIADDAVARTQGLSGRESLADGTGLLFIFEAPGLYGFWMKDMNFPIDILWFDEEKRLIDITKNLSPDTYPLSVYPSSPVMYVLETNVGEFDTNSDLLGQKFELLVK